MNSKTEADEYKKWFGENKDELEYMAKEEAIAQYRSMNITQDDIRRYSKKLAKHKYTKYALRALIWPLMWFVMTSLVF